MQHICGIRLSTFSVVVGWVNLIGAVFSTILLSIGFIYLDDLIKAVQDHFNDNTPNDEATLRTVVIITLCFYLTSSIANMIASALLIIGTIKERHLLLAPWLINTYIVIFYNIINFIYVTYFSIAKGLEPGSIILNVIFTGLSLVVQCIVWQAIFSHFKQLRANQDMLQRLLPTTAGAGAPYSYYTKMPATSQ